MMKQFLILFIIIAFTGNAFAQKDIAVGEKAPEIVITDYIQNVPLEKSMRNKYILLEFWASWCAPCVKEQSELAGCYKQYKDSYFTNGKGFEIYGVSLDNKKVDWENTIKKVKISWTQVSDLKFWNTPVANTYDIQALPFNVLVDGKGIIIVKDLHNNELEYFITNLMSGDETKSKVQ